MMNERFIIDTNTLISAFLIGSSTTSRAFRLALEKGELVTTHAIKREIADVFMRRKFDRYIVMEDRIKILSYMESQFVEWTGPIEKITLCRDAKDDKFLELAAACNASCIITGDKDLLDLHPFRKTLILNSADFLEHFKTSIL
ncbi:putative toxin-antitoxin system toxin component, PIN family [Dyadobacter sp. MSC1_007]|jgi:putative PIN family toxin of toxin-antitoxin system|uniref:putative toxin-antitoxin system toxin component, PIN family n=1 Tax=Dyadobacter sp. MSC1_007 TaxID=2909264 RepID=UPI0020307277|nr:putative toxin-antitoxin system toxin component, PIN family [Dyadobacter sp. MSC1_007]